MKIKIIGGFFLIMLFPALALAEGGMYKTGTFRMDFSGQELGEQEIRISLWSHGMVKSDDIIDGEINTNAIKYGGYQTEVTRTPDVNGIININLDTLNDFPLLNEHKNFVMFEYKDVDDPNTDYVIYREGDLNDTPLSRYSMISFGLDIFHNMYSNCITTADFFVIDGDGSTQPDGSIELRFGALLSESLQWDGGNDRFNLSNDLRISGNLATLGQTYTADSHASSNSDGVMNLGRNNAEWENFMWDDSLDIFVLSDDLTISGEIKINGNTITLDANNSGSGATVEIVAEQGADQNGTLRYNATDNRWEISNDGGDFMAIATPDGWHGSVNRIKILPSDFISEDIDDNAILSSDGSSIMAGTSTTSIGANFPIPTGYTATNIMVYGSDATNAVSIYSGDIANSSSSQIGSGYLNTEIDITDTASSVTNYLSIHIGTENNDLVYGGYITITPTP